MRCSDCGARIPDEYLDGDSFRCPECGRLYRRVTSDEQDTRRREPERRREDAPDDVYADREVLRADRELPPEETDYEDVPPENYNEGDALPLTARAADFFTRRVWKFPMWLLFVVALIIVLVIIFAINGLNSGNDNKTTIITSTATPAPTVEATATVEPTAAVTPTPAATDAPAETTAPSKIYTDVQVPAGSYVVGEKVEAGSYSMRCSSEAGTSSVVSIYADKNTQTTSNIYTMTASNANINRIDLVDGNVLKIEGSDVYFSTYQ